MKRVPLLAGLLSFVFPGLGQCYNRDYSKGIVLICMVLGVLIGLFSSLFGPPQFRSGLSAILFALIYLFVWVPAVADAYQFAAGRPSDALSGKKRWYVVLMLLTVGPTALPLLWASPQFGRRAKIFWSALILFLFVLGLFLILFVIPAAERALEQLGLHVY